MTEKSKFCEPHYKHFKTGDLKIIENVESFQPNDQITEKPETQKPRNDIKN